MTGHRDSWSKGVEPAKSRVVILGAGRPHTGDQPSALRYTSGNLRVLDWIIDAFEVILQPKNRVMRIIGASPQLVFHPTRGLGSVPGEPSCAPRPVVSGIMRKWIPGLSGLLRRDLPRGV